MQRAHTTRQENQELIQHLAHSYFIQEKIGTESDFEKLWHDAFFDGLSFTASPKIQ